MDGRIGTGYFTEDSSVVLEWIDILNENKISFWMTSKIDATNGKTAYFFQTGANEKQDEKLTNTYGFENHYPIGKGEGVL